MFKAISTLFNHKDLTIWDKLQLCALLIYILLLPYGGILHSWIVILLFVTWLIHPGWKLKWILLRSSQWLLLFLSFFFIQCIGLLNTNNLTEAWFKLEQKSAFVIIPIALTSSSLRFSNLRRITIAVFIITGLLSVIINELLSVVEFISSGNTAFLFYTSFSHFLHPAYYSLLLCIILALLIQTYIDDSIKINIWIWVILKMILIVGIFQSASKAGLMAFLLIPAIYWRVLLHKYKLPGNLSGIFIGAALIISISLAYLFREQLRLTNFKFISQEIKADESNIESNQMRIIAWKSSINLIKEEPLFGYGTGDVSDVLIKEYTRQGINSAAEHSLNSHNQYLQCWLAQGILSLLILIGLFIYYVLLAFNMHNKLLLTVALLIGINFLFESMLETRAGLVICVFILPFIHNLYQSEKNTNGAV
jgi:O-antigen ligase